MTTREFFCGLGLLLLAGLWYLYALVLAITTVGWLILAGLSIASGRLSSELDMWFVYSATASIEQIEVVDVEEPRPVMVRHVGRRGVGGTSMRMSNPRYKVEYVFRTEDDARVTGEMWLNSKPVDDAVIAYNPSNPQVNRYEVRGLWYYFMSGLLLFWLWIPFLLLLVLGYCLPKRVSDEESDPESTQAGREPVRFYL